jgi:Flp pilus assembly protein TadB
MTPAHPIAAGSHELARMSGQVSSVAAVLAVLAIGALARAARSRSARSRVRGRLPVPASPAATSTRARPAPAWFASALDAGAIDVDPDRAWWGAVAGVCMLFVAGGLLGGPALAFLAAGATAGGIAVALRTRRGRSMARLEAELPVALEAIARSLRSGATMRAAVAEAMDATSGRLGAHLARVDGDVRRGVPMVDALDAFARRLPLPGVRLAVAALGLGFETGGANARAIDGVAATRPFATGPERMPKPGRSRPRPARRSGSSRSLPPPSARSRSPLMPAPHASSSGRRRD